MKKTLIILLLLLSSYFIIKYGIDLYQVYFGINATPDLAPKSSMPMPPPPASIGMEAGPIKINMSENTPWESIIKLICVVLTTYLGIKVINKYVK